MSTSYVLIVFALVIVLMIVLISKCKVNAAMGILLSAFILAIALGTPWQDIEGTINSGFSSTIKSVAIVIFLGCTMGTVLEKTGAAIRITKWAIGLVGEKHMIWAIALSSAILGIPIWADTVVILLIPIVSMLAVQTKKSMMSYGTALYLGALVTASLVPPTPGPVSAAALLNVPLGQAILWGAIVAVPSVIAATFYCMSLKTPVAPKEEFLAAARETENMEFDPSTGIKLYEGTFRSGLYDGTGVLYDRTTGGKIYEGQFLLGAYHGRGASYDAATGKLLEEGEFRNGVLVTSREELEATEAPEEGAAESQAPEGERAQEGAETAGSEPGQSAGTGEAEPREGAAADESISEPGMSTMEDPEAGKWPGASKEAVSEPGPGA